MVNSIKHLLIASICASASFVTNVSIAQDKSAEQTQASLIGSWLAIVEDSPDERTLKVLKVSRTSETTYSMEAEYGWTGKELPVSSAEVVQSGKESALAFTARSGAKIVATQQPDGSFVGTFSYRSEPVKGIRLSRSTGNEIRSYPAVEKAARDVPLGCAAFLGGWTGTWNVSGRVWLWVTSVDANCNAKYAYASNAYPRAFKTAEIKGGVLEVPVSRGVNYFRFNGDKLYDRYIGGGVDDTLEFNRVDVSSTPMSSAQAVAAAIAKPAPDVPSACAAFSGRWTGTWGYGIGQQWLWVASVDAKCSANIAYLANSDVPSAFQTAEIKDGTLAVTCGGVDTCKFNVRGEELHAVAYGTAGANNNAVFKKLP